MLPLLIHFFYRLLLLFQGSFVPFLLPIWPCKLSVFFLVDVFPKVFEGKVLIILVAFPELFGFQFSCFTALSIIYQPILRRVVTPESFPSARQYSLGATEEMAVEELNVFVN